MRKMFFFFAVTVFFLCGQVGAATDQSALTVEQWLRHPDAQLFLRKVRSIMSECRKLRDREYTTGSPRGDVPRVVLFREPEGVEYAITREQFRVMDAEVCCGGGYREIRPRPCGMGLCCLVIGGSLFVLILCTSMESKLAIAAVSVIGGIAVLWGLYSCFLSWCKVSRESLINRREIRKFLDDDSRPIAHSLESAGRRCLLHAYPHGALFDKYLHVTTLFDMETLLDEVGDRLSDVEKETVVERIAQFAHLIGNVDVDQLAVARSKMYDIELGQDSFSEVDEFLEKALIKVIDAGVAMGVESTTEWMPVVFTYATPGGHQRSVATWGASYDVADKPHTVCPAIARHDEVAIAIEEKER